jgi:hypothetical protein
MVAQRAYYDAMQSLHAALLNVCADFHGEGYSRVRAIRLLAAVSEAACCLLQCTIPLSGIGWLDSTPEKNCPPAVVAPKPPGYTGCMRVRAPSFNMLR